MMVDVCCAGGTGLLLDDAFMAQLQRQAAAAGADAARLVAEEGAKRQKLSVTAYTEVGAQLLVERDAQQILPLGNTEVPPIVNEAFKRKWANISDEAGVQV